MKKALDLVRLEAQTLEDDTHANTQGVGNPTGKNGFVFDRIKVVHING
jgi:hypothetical protein